MDVLRKKEAKSKNRMPGLVKAGALAMATTVKPHNPTSDRSPSSNDKGVEKLIEKHQTMAPPVESPIRPRMNTNIRPLLIVPSTFLSILFAIFVFKMWKSGDNENQESGDNVNQEQRDRKDQITRYKYEILDLDEKIRENTSRLKTRRWITDDSDSDSDVHSESDSDVHSESDSDVHSELDDDAFVCKL